MNNENNTQNVTQFFCTRCGNQLSPETKFCTNCGNARNSTTTFQLQTIPYTNQQLPTKKKPNMTIKAYVFPIIIGIVFILAGLRIQVPGGVLTTYESLNGDITEGYAFDNKYASIDEYVGGDAYNYIIGASLVAGKISGAMTTKAIFVVGGTLCLCLGIISKILQEKKTIIKNSVSKSDISTSAKYINRIL